MTGIFPRIDGIHGILFHVEHSGDVPWLYRWRLAEPATGIYRVWQEQTSRTPFAVIESPAVGAVLEVESAPDMSSPWAPVTVLSLSQGHATFRVEAAKDFTSPVSGFMVCAPGKHSGVSAYRFPHLRLAAGESAEVIAHADAPVFANLLLAPGDFAPRIEGLTITNLTPSTGSLSTVPGSPPIQLSACPLCTSRKLYAYGVGDVDPEKIREWLAAREGGAS